MKNPHATKIKEHGYSVTVHYSPKDLEHFDDSVDIIQALVELMSPNDTRELLEHMINTYKIPCTPIAKETILSSRPRKNLAQLFEMYPVDYIEDEELDWGKPIGDEIW